MSFDFLERIPTMVGKYMLEVYHVKSRFSTVDTNFHLVRYYNIKLDAVLVNEGICVVCLKGVKCCYL